MPSGGSHGHWTCFCLLHRLTPRKYATSPCLRVHASPLEGKPGMLLLQVMEALYSVSYSSSKRNLASCLVDLTVLPWKSTASLNELHPSLLSVSCVVYMIITAAVSVLLQHLLLFSFFFLNKHSCDPCSSTWPSPRTQIICSPQPHRQNCMQNYCELLNL